MAERRCGGVPNGGVPNGGAPSGGAPKGVELRDVVELRDAKEPWKRAWEWMWTWMWEWTRRWTWDAEVDVEVDAGVEVRWAKKGCETLSSCEASRLPGGAENT